MRGSGRTASTSQRNPSQVEIAAPKKRKRTPYKPRQDLKLLKTQQLS